LELKGNIEFNSLKHHLNYTIIKLAEVNRNDNNRLLKELNKIGNNILDLYIGKLTSAQIVEELLNKIKSVKVTDKNSFEFYLGNEGYKKLEVSDGSQWILRLGTMKQAFIHIHPSRNGKFTSRIKGSAWKTSIASKLFEEELQIFDNLLGKVNFVRIKYLKLSPVKSLKKNSNIAKANNFLNK
jgi:hypothetical protein